MNLGPTLEPECGVKVREWFVEQQHPRAGRLGAGPGLAERLLGIYPARESIGKRTAGSIASMLPTRHLGAMATFKVGQIAPSNIIIITRKGSGNGRGRGLRVTVARCVASVRFRDGSVHGSVTRHGDASVDRITHLHVYEKKTKKTKKKMKKNEKTFRW